MGDATLIPWTDATWNPTRGCSMVDDRCERCYAMWQAMRLAGPGKPYEGLVRPTPNGPRWTGVVSLADEATLGLPLRWKRPRRIFVDSMSDLFHEAVADEDIMRVFAVMARAHWHTFQVLTKRPARMLDWFQNYARNVGLGRDGLAPFRGTRLIHDREYRWPLPNVWLGVSVSRQADADRDGPLLRHTPAAVRWVSYEPALGPVLFHWPLPDWIVVGGESGPGARPFNLAWARSTVAQGRAAGVPVFVKQLGRVAVEDGLTSGGLVLDLRDRKGEDPSEWPEDLRGVREFPG